MLESKIKLVAIKDLSKEQLEKALESILDQLGMQLYIRKDENDMPHLMLTYKKVDV